MTRRNAAVRHENGFTIVEVIVVVAIVAVLVGLLLPVAATVRERAGGAKCASNLRQLGVATINYMAIYESQLPQVTVPNPKGEGELIIGSLFGGKAGQLPFYEIDQRGAKERPLNAFLNNGSLTDEDMPMFECPLDRGQPANPALYLPDVDSMYDFIGTSYTLNDHSLDSEDCHTLVPGQRGDTIGGRMPRVADPTKTWMLADQVVYNYQQGGDLGQRWHKHDTICNMCFVDGHVDQNIKLEPVTDEDGDGFYDQNTTSRYTFLPQSNWLERHCGN